MRVKKLLSVFLIAVMLAAYLPAAPASADELIFPEIPYEDDLAEYVPKEDGYYGYLKVRYFPVPSVYESEDVYMPVTVWKGVVFAEIHDLALIAGLMLDDQSSRIEFSVFDRYLYMSVQEQTAYYVQGKSSHGNFITSKVTLNGMPYFDNDVKMWVPMSDVLTIFDISAVSTEDEEGNTFYIVYPARENSFDVLARLNDEDNRENDKFTYEISSVYESVKEKMEKSARWTTTLDRMLRGKGEYYKYFGLSIADRFLDIFNKNQNWSQDQWNQIVAENMLYELWFCSEDEALAMSERCADINGTIIPTALDLSSFLPETALVYMQKSNQGLRDFLELVEQGVSDPSLNFLNTLFRENEIAGIQKLIQSSEDVMEIMPNIWEAVSYGSSAAFTEVGAVFSFLNFVSGYDGRDQMLEDAMSDFLDRPAYPVIGSAAAEKMKTAFDEIRADYLDTGTKKTIVDSLMSFGTDALIGALSNAGGLLLAAYKICTFFEHSTLDEMDKYLTSLFGLSLQDETENVLRIQMFGNAERWQGSELMHAIRDAYLFLKTCYITRSDAMVAVDWGDAVPYLSSVDEAILSDLSILYEDYALSESGLPSSCEQRFAALAGQSDAQLIEDVIGLYVTVSGDVKNLETEEPVTDAYCEVYSKDDEYIGYFRPGEDGTYEDISVPVLIPKEMVSEAELEFDVRFDFTSETVEGEDVLRLPFESELEKDMKTAWLGGTGTMGVAVESGDSIFYRRYSKASHSTPGLTGYFMILINGVSNPIVRIKDGEETVIADSYGDGELVAAKGQIFFSGELREDGQTIKSVSMDGGEITTICAGDMLDVTRTGSHIILKNSNGLYTLNTSAASSYLMNKISTSGNYVSVYGQRVIYEEMSGNTMRFYSVAVDDDDDVMYLGSLDMSFVDSLSGPCIGEVRMPTIDGEDYLYVSYGSIAGSYIMYQSGGIARFNLNKEDSAEIMVDPGSRADADFTVNEDGSVNTYEYQYGRLSVGLYSGNNKFYGKDGYLYSIDPADGHSEALIGPEDYASVTPATIDVNDDGTYLKVAYYTKQKDHVYVYCTLGKVNGDSLGWRPSFDLEGVVLLQKDLETGEVEFLVKE